MGNKMRVSVRFCGHSGPCRCSAPVWPAAAVLHSTGAERGGARRFWGSRCGLLPEAGTLAWKWGHIGLHRCL